MGKREKVLALSRGLQTRCALVREWLILWLVYTSPSEDGKLGLILLRVNENSVSEVPAWNYRNDDEDEDDDLTCLSGS